MRDRIKTVALFAIATTFQTLTTGCAAIEEIFKAGVWVGVVAVGFVFCLALAAMSMLRR